jgi:hypothetical protein
VLARLASAGWAAVEGSGNWGVVNVQDIYLSRAQRQIELINKSSGSATCAFVPAGEEY